MPKAPCCEKVGLKRGKWTREEDEILTKYMNTHGVGSWRSLPKKAGLLRCGKSCRLRWINYLRRDLKRGNITTEEDHIIVKMHSLVGNRWSLIASHLPGRTDNEIKNYWRSHLSRKIIAFKHNQIADDLVLKKFSSSSTSEAKNKQMVTTSQCFPQPKEIESETIEGECFEPYQWLDTEIKGLMSSEEDPIGLNDDQYDQNKTCESVEVQENHDINENSDEDWWIGLCNSLEVGIGIDEEEIHKWEFQSCATHLSRKIYAFSSVSADDLLVKKSSYSSSETKNKNVNKTNQKKKKKGRTSRSPMKKHKQMVMSSKCFTQLKELESEITSERECFEPYEWLDTEIKGLMSGEESNQNQNKTCESGEVQENHDINMEKQREESVLELNSNENGDEDRWTGQCNSLEVGFGIAEEEMHEWEFQNSVTHPSDDELWSISDLEDVTLV